MNKRTEFLLILIEEQIRRDYLAGNVSKVLADEAWHALYDIYDTIVSPDSPLSGRTLARPVSVPI